MHLKKVVTSTGLDDKNFDELLKFVEEKFPDIVEHSPNLTSDVNILIIDIEGSNNSWLKSKKFLYVVQFRPDVKIVSLTDFFKIVNHQDLNKLKQIKPFTNLKISLSRLDDNLLTKIEKLVNNNGGEVIHYLSNDTDIMISMLTEGKRYAMAIQWGIPIVSPDWCFDSMNRGLPVSSKCYYLSQNVTDVITKLNFIGEEDKTGTQTMVKAYHMGKRDEACDWDKLKEWKDNEKSRQLEQYIKNKIDGIIPESDDRENNNDDVDKTKTKEKTIIEDTVVVKRRKLNARESNTGNLSGFETDELWNSILSQTTKPSTIHTQEAGIISKNKWSAGVKRPILHGLKFNTIGFEQEQNNKLIKVIKKFGGTVIDNSKIVVDFTVVSINYEKPIAGSNLITEFAIERFIFNEKIDSGDYLWCKPFYIDPEIKTSKFAKTVLNYNDKSENMKYINLEKLKISITGFSGTDLSQFERLLTGKLANWVEFQTKFTKSCQLLIIGKSHSTGSELKEKMAAKWDIPLQTVDMFFERVVMLSSSAS